MAAGLDDLAYSMLEKADSPEALIRLGDLLGGKKQWTKAAERYRQAWQKSWRAEQPLKSGKHADPLPLYLAGDALVKAGKDKEGRKLMDQSHWVLLGDAPGRFAFIRALAERGHAEAAARETELLRCVSEPNTYYSGAALRRLAVAAAGRKEYLKAAEGYEQSMLRCLHTNTNFLQASAYSTVPAQIHQLRASASARRGTVRRGRQTDRTGPGVIAGPRGVANRAGARIGAARPQETGRGAVRSIVRSV